VRRGAANQVTHMDDDPEQRVYDALEALGIPYERFEHPAVFTVEQADEHWAGIDATHCKNLFLRNKKGTTHYLVIAEHWKPVEIATLTAKLGEDRLSFASPERLMTHLGLTPGSVSPFGLINDAGKAVRVVIDADLQHAARVGFHPNVNTATIVLAWSDFRRFLDWRGNIVRYLRLA
jgi:Ala-tRNA(Pro) deacylase